MSEVLQQFLQSNLPLQGLAAWCLALPDGTLQTTRCTDTLALPQAEEVVRALTAAGQALEPHGLQPVRFCWVFENARLHLALRPEGVRLALMMENRPELVNGQAERVLETFLQMPRTW